jgi:hypothetical protein
VPVEVVGSGVAEEGLVSLEVGAVEGGGHGVFSFKSCVGGR